MTFYTFFEFSHILLEVCSYKCRRFWSKHNARFCMFLNHCLDNPQFFPIIVVHSLVLLHGNYECFRWDLSCPLHLIITIVSSNSALCHKISPFTFTCSTYYPNCTALYVHIHLLAWKTSAWLETVDCNICSPMCNKPLGAVRSATTSGCYNSPYSCLVRMITWT